MHGLADKVRLVTGDLDLHPGGQELAHLGQATPHRINRGDRVGARLLANDERDRVLAIVTRQGARLDNAVFDPAEVGYGNRRALVGGNDDVGELTHCAHPAERAQHSFATVLGEPTARKLDILLGQSLSHSLHRQVVRFQALGVDQDLDLTLAPADERDRAHSRDRFQRLLHPLLSDLGEFLEPLEA